MVTDGEKIKKIKQKDTKPLHNGNGYTHNEGIL